MEGEAKPITPHTPTPPGPPPEAALRSVAGALSSARRPALVTGAALEMAGGWAAAIDLAEKLALEVYATPHSARTGFPTAHPNFRGYLPNSAPALHETLEQHDVVLVVGAPVFVMYPYVESEYLPPNVRLILMTDDPDEAARLERGEAHLGDLRAALKALLDVSEPTERRVESQPGPPPPDNEGSRITLLRALHVARPLSFIRFHPLADGTVGTAPTPGLRAARCRLRRPQS